MIQGEYLRNSKLLSGISRMPFTKDQVYWKHVNFTHICTFDIQFAERSLIQALIG
jgi:hypothetical protein